jgi:hypothetical protein
MKDYSDHCIPTAQIHPTKYLCYRSFGGNSRTDSKIGYYNGLRHDDTDWKSSGGISAIPVYFYEFTKYDLRRDVNIAIFRVNTSKQEELQTSINWNDGKFRKSWTSITGTSQNLGIDWPLLRYADILLMFAEADNELNNGPSAQAVNAVLSVRQRAYAGNLSQVELFRPTKQDSLIISLKKDNWNSEVKVLENMI